MHQKLFRPFISLIFFFFFFLFLTPGHCALILIIIVISSSPQWSLVSTYLKEVRFYAWYWYCVLCIDCVVRSEAEVLLSSITDYFSSFWQVWI